MRRRVGWLVLWWAAASPTLGAQTGSALDLLTRTLAHYRQAETVHVEATEVRTTHNEYHDSTERHVYSMIRAPGGRFRYEAAGWTGAATVVSDGTTEWYFSGIFRQYTVRPAGTYVAEQIGKPMMGAELDLHGAAHLLEGIEALDAHIRDAHFGAPEDIVVAGRTVRCAVVRFGRADSTLAPAQLKHANETTLWIDPTRLLLLKQRTSGSSFLAYGPEEPPYAASLEVTDELTYTVAELDAPPDAADFTFAPSPGSKQVAELPSPFPNTPAGENPVARMEATRKQHDGTFEGKPLPAIVLHEADGKAVPVSTFRGHPLLLDVWATWCGPCLAELPALGRFGGTYAGLTIVGIDEDAKGADAAAFLKRHGYAWQDFHYDKDLVKALGVNGIPVLMLVDAQGTVVYYHTGMGDDAGLEAALASLERKQ